MRTLRGYRMVDRRSTVGRPDANGNVSLRGYLSYWRLLTVCHLVVKKQHKV
jgi:hypothetical protein